MYKSLETEVLVIGGGGAGCRAAIEAHDKGSKVLMMLKGRLGNSGCTLWVGISSAVGSWGGDKSDSTETSMIDLLSYGVYLGNQDLAKILSDESADRVHEMEEWGIDGHLCGKCYSKKLSEFYPGDHVRVDLSEK